MTEPAVQRVEIEKERQLWRRCIITAQFYLVVLSLTCVHYLFNPFKLPPTVVLILTGVVASISTALLIGLCVFFCRPTREVLRPVPVRKLTAASVETDPAFYIGGTLE